MWRDRARRRPGRPGNLQPGQPKQTKTEPPTSASPLSPGAWEAAQGQAGQPADLRPRPPDLVWVALGRPGQRFWPRRAGPCGMRPQSKGCAEAISGRPCQEGSAQSHPAAGRSQQSHLVEWSRFQQASYKPELKEVTGMGLGGGERMPKLCPVSPPRCSLWPRPTDRAPHTQPPRDQEPRQPGPGPRTDAEAWGPVPGDPATMAACWALRIAGPPDREQEASRGPGCPALASLG